MATLEEKVKKHNEFTTRWYGFNREIIPPLDTSKFFSFIGSKLDLFYHIAGYDNIYRFIVSDKMTTAGIDTTKREVYLPLIFFDSRFYIWQLKLNHDFRYIATANINGNIVHEALHVKYTPKFNDLLYAYEKISHEYEKLPPIPLLQMAFGVLEDIYIENRFLKRDLSSYKPFLRCNHDILFTEEEVKEASETFDNSLKSGLRVLMSFKNPEFRSLSYFDCIKSALEKIQIEDYITDSAVNNSLISHIERVRRAYKFCSCFDFQPADKDDFIKNLQQAVDKTKDVKAEKEEKERNQKENGEGEGEKLDDNTIKKDIVIAEPESDKSKKEKEKLQSKTAEQDKESFQKAERETYTTIKPFFGLSQGDLNIPAPLYFDVLDLALNDNVPNINRRGFLSLPGMEEKESENDYKFIAELLRAQVTTHTYGEAMSRGRKIANPRIYRIATDAKIFYNPLDVKTIKPYEVIILIDSSGSMLGRDVGHTNHFYYALRVSKGIFTALRESRIKVKLYGHTSYFGRDDYPVIFQIADSEKSAMLSERFKIASRVNCRENYDSIALEKLLELNPYRNTPQLWLVLSDGIPSGRHGYHGEYGNNATKEAVKKVRSTGIKIMAISLVDSVTPYLQKFYGEEDVIDGSIDLKQALTLALKRNLLSE